MHGPQCQAFRPFMTLFSSLVSDNLSQQCPQGSGYGFPSVTSKLQHLVFKMSFHDIRFTAPSPSSGGEEKVILFQRTHVNYSTSLCIAYSLQSKFLLFLCPQSSRQPLNSHSQDKHFLIIFSVLTHLFTIS